MPASRPPWARTPRTLRWPPVPAMRSRRDAFDDYVLDAAARLEATCGRAFPAVEFAVEDVPRGPAPWDHREVPLGRLFLATASRPARIVVYRRPVETRVGGRRDVAALVADIVTEQVAGLLGSHPRSSTPASATRRSAADPTHRHRQRGDGGRGERHGRDLRHSAPRLRRPRPPPERRRPRRAQTRSARPRSTTTVESGSTVTGTVRRSVPVAIWTSRVEPGRRQTGATASSWHRGPAGSRPRRRGWRGRRKPKAVAHLVCRRGAPLRPGRGGDGPVRAEPRP